MSVPLCIIGRRSELVIMWSIGQQIVCINGSFPQAVWEWCNSVPIADNVYTIREVTTGHDYHTGVCGVGFYLVEIVNPRTSKGLEACFCATRFVPLTCELSAEHPSTAEPAELQAASY